jgi:hypothetical protein
LANQLLKILPLQGTMGLVTSLAKTKTEGSQSDSPHLGHMRAIAGASHPPLLLASSFDHPKQQILSSSQWRTLEKTRGWAHSYFFA